MKKIIKSCLKKMLSQGQRERIRTDVHYALRVIKTFEYQVRDTISPQRRPNKSVRSNDKVSIVIPTLSKDSHADHLPKLEQLLSEYLPSQIHKNYEAIVYCDGPNQMVENMAVSLKDNRIKVYATDHTLGKWGHPQTRMGIIAATGKYFVRMNDDNQPYKKYLQTLLSGFDQDEGIVYGRVVYKGEARKVHDSSLVNSFVIPQDKKAILRLRNIDCMNYMIRMDLAKKYVDYWDDSYSADWVFLEALLKDGIKAKFSDKMIGRKF